jgi:hypothetical protein
MLGRDDGTPFAEHLIWMASNRDSLQSFSAMLTDGELPTRNRIVMDRYGAFLFPRICQTFPNADVSLLPDTDDIAVAAKAVAASHVFVACHISAVVLGMFSHGAVLEVQPHGLECTTFGSLWTAVSGAVYVPVRNDTVCDCGVDDFSCYLETAPVWHRINEATVIQAIVSAFKQTCGQIAEDEPINPSR